MPEPVEGIVYTLVDNAYRAPGYPPLTGTDPDPDPDPPAQRLLGLYNGIPSESPDQKTFNDFGRYADIASTYYQVDKVELNQAYETARIQRGTVPFITLSCKDQPGLLTQIADKTPTGLSFIDQYIAALGTISQVDTNIPVYATIEHEHEVKANQNVLTGTDADSAVFGEALSVFAERCHTASPLVRCGLWVGAFDKASINDALNAMRTVGWQWMAMDCYATDTNMNENTLTDSCASDVAWLRANSNYARLGSPEVGLGEFGKDTFHGDASVAAYMTNLRGQMQSNNLAFALLFNRDKLDPDGQFVKYLISGAETPLSRAAFAASLAG